MSIKGSEFKTGPNKSPFKVIIIISNLENTLNNAQTVLRNNSLEVAQPVGPHLYVLGSITKLHTLHVFHKQSSDNGATKIDIIGRYHVRYWNNIFDCSKSDS